MTGRDTGPARPAVWLPASTAPTPGTPDVPANPAPDATWSGGPVPSGGPAPSGVPAWAGSAVGTTPPAGLAPQDVVRFAPPRRDARRPAFTTGLLVAALLVSGAAWWVNDEVARLAPPAGLEETGAPLGAPPPESALDTGEHAFSALQPDGVGPVTYSPCRPLHYVVRPDGAPPEGELLIRTAIERVAHATGLQFVDDGATTEGPSPDREAFQPDLYGRRWAPVLFTWSNETETPGLAGDVAGTGGSASVTVDGRSVYVTGEVTLDTAEITELVASPNGTAVAIGVVTHELAHVVGLGHVDDPTQLMYPSTNVAVTAFAAGDRAGLAELGRGECAPDV